MARRLYRLHVFKTISGRDVYGAKSYMGHLDDMCRIVERKFPSHTHCRVLGPGRYDIGGGLAELEVVR